MEELEAVAAAVPVGVAAVAVTAMIVIATVTAVLFLLLDMLNLSMKEHQRGTLTYHLIRNKSHPQRKWLREVTKMIEESRQEVDADHGVVAVVEVAVEVGIDKKVGEITD